MQWDERTRGFVNIGRQGIYEKGTVKHRYLWAAFGEQDSPTIPPFTKACAMESVRARNGNKSSDGRVHPFKTYGTCRKFVH
jgi:hypothetical protein